MKTKLLHFFHSVFHLYYDGFKSMKTGRTLWLIVAIKLFIMFVIIKWLFFPDILKEKFQTDEQRSEYILQHLTKEKH